MKSHTPNPVLGCTVVLEDHGQDFLEFDIVGQKIVETRPFQGFVWNGKEITVKRLAPGDYLVFTNDYQLNYRVAAVRHLQADTEVSDAPYSPRDKARAERKRREAKCNDGLAVPEKRGNVRACLCCKKSFLTQGAHNRLCTTCRVKSVGPYDL